MSLQSFLLAAAGNSSVAPPSTDPNFATVAMLLHGNGTNGVQNSTWVDSSTNNAAITVTSTPIQGTWTPYGSNWSVFLPSAAASYATYGASTSASPGSSNFTMEAWVNLSGLPTSGLANLWNILQKGRSAASNFEFSFSILNTSGVYNVCYQSAPDGVSVSTYTSNAITPVMGQWYHLAITRVSGVVTFWINGVSSGTTGATTGTGATAAAVGVGNNNAGGDAIFSGYMSNVRVVYGTAVYTSNFTPPTAPLTAIAGTNFLGFQSNRFVDNSTNAWTVTQGGSAQVVRLNPFGDNGTPYTTSTYAGSTLFQAAGNTLSCATSTNFGFGTGAFTIEAWVYTLSYNSNSGSIIDLRASVSASAVSIGVNNTGNLYYYDGPGNTTYTDAGLVGLNTWTHMALVRTAAGVWTMYRNGVSVATNTNADNVGSSQPILIGQSVNGTTNYYNGYVAGLRIVKGTAVYTANFTPPTAPPTAISGTSFLLNSTNSGVLDNAMQQNLQTLGTCKISTAASQFGGGSIAFDGSTNCYVDTQLASMPQWGSANFTIEGWFNFTSTAGTNYTGVFGQRASVSVYAPVVLGVQNGVFVANLSTNGTAWTTTITASAGPTLATFQHVALVRNGSTVTLYLNGSSIGSGTVSGALYTAITGFVLGAPGLSTVSPIALMVGFVNDFRISYGLARYTANFASPTAPFPNQ